jgi:hypothetical protein
MTVPNLSSSLSGLYQSIDQRLGSFKKLMQLGGRLDLIMSQINIKNQRLGAAIETSSTISMVEDGRWWFCLSWPVRPFLGRVSVCQSGNFFLGSSRAA